jgi:hypothetical protein
VGYPLLTVAGRRSKHGRPRRGAGCFCSELTAIDISSAAEILGRRWFGDLKNSEMTLVMQPSERVIPSAHLPNLEKYFGPEVYQVRNNLSI